MTANTSILMSVPDFSSIKGSLVNYLRGQDRFADYDFEGSNLSVLLDVLAYNTYQNAFLTNMVASEMFLDTAQLDASIISHAKELGYTPRSSRSSVANIDITIEPTDDPGSIIIPKNTMFSTNIGNESYTFMTDEAHIIVVANGVYQASNVNVYEGFTLTEYYTANTLNTSQQFIISNELVDTTSVEVYVSSSGAAEEAYVFTSSITDITANSKVFFIQQDHSRKYELKFGDGVLGAAIPHGAVIRTVYRVCAADAPNGCSEFSAVSTIGGYTDITVTTNTVGTGGTAAESNESIRKYAPLLYQTRGRAITASDYKTLLQQEFAEIRAINVYGGENVVPPQYGRVIISADIGNASGIPSTKREEYYRFLKAKNPTIIEPIFIDPSYIYVQLSSSVYYDYTLTSLSDADIKAAVAAAITSYNDDNLNSFDAVFRASKLGNVIDSAHSAINSNDTEHSLYKIIDVANISESSQAYNFYNEIRSTGNINVTSNNFKYDDKLCKLKDSNGEIYITTEDSSGNTTNVQKVGTVDYTTGSVTLFAFTIQEIYSASLKVIVYPANKDIQAKYNNVIQINNADVNITTVPQRR